LTFFQLIPRKTPPLHFQDESFLVIYVKDYQKIQFFDSEVLDPDPTIKYPIWTPILSNISCFFSKEMVRNSALAYFTQFHIYRGRIQDPDPVLSLLLFSTIPYPAPKSTYLCPRYSTIYICAAFVLHIYCKMFRSDVLLPLHNC
jgi:hypothetical protein